MKITVKYDLYDLLPGAEFVEQDNDGYSNGERFTIMALYGGDTVYFVNKTKSYVVREFESYEELLKFLNKSQFFPVKLKIEFT